MSVLRGIQAVSAGRDHSASESTLLCCLFSGVAGLDTFLRTILDCFMMLRYIHTYLFDLLLMIFACW